MAREPKKESFFAQLKAADFDGSSLLKDTDDLQEILWFLEEKRTKEILADLLNPQKTSRDDAEQIIKNLAKIYPLSKTLVMSLMANRSEPRYPNGEKIYRDASFLEGFDTAEAMKNSILATFGEINNRIIFLSSEVRDYTASLNKLTADYDRLKNAATNSSQLRQERDELQAKIDQLRADADEKKVREQIDELKLEIQKYNSDKTRREAEIKEQRKRLDEVKAELRDLGKNSDSAEETRLIKDLLKKFPLDAAEDKS